MTHHKKRNLFSITNKYQKRILILCVVPQLMISFGLTGFVFYINSQMDQMVSRQPASMWAQGIATWLCLFFSLVIGIVILSLIFTFKFSQNLVNPFERIIREIDDVLATHNKKVIKARPDDELANDLLKRINELIARMS